MLSKISRVLKNLGNVCIGLTVMIALVFSLFVVPRFFGISPFVVLSSSMEPAIPTGSVVFTNTNDTDVKIGDIITYSLSTGVDSGVMVTHRVYNMDEERGLIQTKGDNNDQADGWLDKSAIKGTVLYYAPKLGFVLDGLQNVGFIIIAIWVFVINLLLMLIPHLLDALNKEEVSNVTKFKVKVASRNRENNNRKGDGYDE